MKNVLTLNLPPDDQALWDLHMKALFYPLLLAADELGFFKALSSGPLSGSSGKKLFRRKF